MQFQINKTLLIFYQLKQATCPFRNQEGKKKKKKKQSLWVYQVSISGVVKKKISIILGFQRAEKQKSGYNNKKRKAGEKEKETYQLGFERCWLER